MKARSGGQQSSGAADNGRIVGGGVRCDCSSDCDNIGDIGSAGGVAPTREERDMQAALWRQQCTRVELLGPA